jgi:predicted transcriptional regulator YdeE
VELAHIIKTEQARLVRIEARLQQIEKENTVTAHEVVLKSVLPQKVAGIREIVPDVSHVPILVDELEAYLLSNHEPLDVTRPYFGVYYDREYCDQEVDLEIGVPLAKRSEGTSRVRVHELPGVETMACVVHQGNLNQLPAVYNRLMFWVEMSGYQVVGPMRELFLQRPLPPHNHAANITEVQFPIKEKPYLSVIKKFKEQTKMEPEVKSKPAFTVIGMQYHGKNENNKIPQLWGKFIPRMAEIQHKVVSGESFGVCGELEEDGKFKYVAGFEVSKTADMPAGMVSWEVPQHLYAIFPCTIPTISETYNYIHQTWLPESGYKRADAPDFELYDESFNAEDTNSILYVYIPVE